MKLRLPWSVTFVRRHLTHMTLASAWRYRSVVIRDGRGLIRGPVRMSLRLRRPIPGRVELRYGTSDMRTFDEVVVAQVYRDVCEAVPNCRYVIDLGGNVGLAARYFAQHYPACRILSVEPDAENFELYRRNMSVVPAARWSVLRAAAWRTNEQVSVCGPPNGSDYDSIRVASGSGDGPARTVPGLTPAEIVRRAGFPHVDLLKIDVEGAESELFRDDTGWLNQVRAIAIEFHSDSRDRCRFDEVMGRHRFAVRELNAHTTLAVGPGVGGGGVR